MDLIATRGFGIARWSSDQNSNRNFVSGETFEVELVSMVGLVVLKKKRQAMGCRSVGRWFKLGFLKKC